MRLSSCCARVIGVAAWKIGEKTDEAKGFLLSLVALRSGEEAIRCLDDRGREECSGAWGELGRLEEGALGAVLSGWRARAKNGLPQGIERLHPSWIEAALASEPPFLLRYFSKRLPEPLRPAVERLMPCGGGGGPDPRIDIVLGREIDTIAFGHLALLCESACGALAINLCAMGFEELRTEVTRMGARALGRSLVGSEAAVQSRAMAMAGEPWASLIAEGLRQPLASDQRRTTLAHLSTSVKDSACTGAERLLHIGLVALKMELLAEGGGSLRRVAGRLPESLGRELLSM
jgi:hypothetical protein